jgi:serine/threonine-protein kinase
VSTVAALVVFLAALLVGMTWFSPDHSSAETPPTDPPRTTSPSPGAPSTLSTPPIGGEEPGNNADEGSGRQQHTQKGKNGHSKDDKG